MLICVYKYPNVVIRIAIIPVVQMGRQNSLSDIFEVFDFINFFKVNVVRVVTFL